MPSESRRPFFSRSKALWCVVGFPLAVLVALLCVWFYQQSEVDSQLAALRAKGMPTTAKELNDFYKVPEGTADTTNLWLIAIATVQAADIRKRASVLPFLGDGAVPTPAPGEAWAELDASRKFLGESGDALQAIRRAAGAGGQVRFPIDFSQGNPAPRPRHNQLCDVARLLVLDAHVCAHDGKNSQALRDVRAIFALSDALRGIPMVVSQLTQISIHAIGAGAVEELIPHCRWSETDLKSLQTAILSARFNEDISHALCGERATCLSATNGLPWPLRQSNVYEALRFYESSIAGFSGSWPENLSRHRELDAKMKALAAGTLTRLRVKSVLQAVGAVSEQLAFAGARAEARQRCANTALAAQRFRLQHGRLPNSLAEIEQVFLGKGSQPSAQITDPFTGQPLRYKSHPTRVLIYSVGGNAQDDGGVQDPDLGRAFDDIGFSLKN